MRILITGGNGLVGSALRELVSNIPEHNWIFVSSKDYDLRRQTEVERMFWDVKPDSVVHLAANVGGLYKNIQSKVSMYEDNILINTNVIQCANKCGVQRLIGMCSTCVFPDTSLSGTLHEGCLHDGPPHSSNEGYAYAKRLLEVHCRIISTYHGREYICLIPTNIYGPHDNFNISEGHVLPSLIHKCMIAKARQEPFVVFGSGKPLRQFVYSKDLARFTVQLLLGTKEMLPNTVIFSPDEDEEISISNLANMIARNFNYCNIVFDPSADDGQYKKTCNNARLKEIAPQFKFTLLSEGLTETIDWFLKNYSTCRK